MRFKHIDLTKNIDKKYLLIVDAIDFCDVYVGKFDKGRSCLNDCLVTPTSNDKILSGCQHGIGIKLTYGVHFSEWFLNNKKNHIFELNKEQYDMLFKIKNASVLRKIKRYCF